MADLIPAVTLAQQNTTQFPGESAEYRRARQALLAEEIELRRHIERVAEQRRALPPGGEVPKNYEFIAEGGRNRRRKPLNLWRKLKIRRRIGYWGPA